MVMNEWSAKRKLRCESVVSVSVSRSMANGRRQGGEKVTLLPFVCLSLSEVLTQL